jgi:hypothetical protein
VQLAHQSRHFEEDTVNGEVALSEPVAIDLPFNNFPLNFCSASQTLWFLQPLCSVSGLVRPPQLFQFCTLSGERVRAGVLATELARGAIRDVVLASTANRDSHFYLARNYAQGHSFSAYDIDGHLLHSVTLKSADSTREGDWRFDCDAASDLLAVWSRNRTPETYRLSSGELLSPQGRQTSATDHSFVVRCRSKLFAYLAEQPGKPTTLLVNCLTTGLRLRAVTCQGRVISTTPSTSRSLCFLVQYGLSSTGFRYFNAGTGERRTVPVGNEFRNLVCAEDYVVGLTDAAEGWQRFVIADMRSGTPVLVLVPSALPCISER